MDPHIRSPYYRPLWSPPFERKESDEESSFDSMELCDEAFNNFETLQPEKVYFNTDCASVYYCEQERQELGQLQQTFFPLFNNDFIQESPATLAAVAHVELGKTKCVDAKKEPMLGVVSLISNYAICALGMTRKRLFLMTHNLDAFDQPEEVIKKIWLLMEKKKCTPSSRKIAILGGILSTPGGCVQSLSDLRKFCQLSRKYPIVAIKTDLTNEYSSVAAIFCEKGLFYQNHKKEPFFIPKSPFDCTLYTKKKHTSRQNPLERLKAERGDLFQNQHIQRFPSFHSLPLVTSVNKDEIAWDFQEKGKWDMQAYLGTSDVRHSYAICGCGSSTKQHVIGLIHLENGSPEGALWTLTDGLIRRGCEQGTLNLYIIGGKLGFGETTNKSLILLEDLLSFGSRYPISGVKFNVGAPNLALKVAISPFQVLYGGDHLF